MFLALLTKKFSVITKVSQVAAGKARNIFYRCWSFAQLQNKSKQQWT
jgi:hypothetical protein